MFVISIRLFSLVLFFFFFSSRRRHTRCSRDWSSDVCSSDLMNSRRRSGIGHLRSRSRVLLSKPRESGWGLRATTGRSLAETHDPWRARDYAVKPLRKVLTLWPRFFCAARGEVYFFFFLFVSEKRFSSEARVNSSSERPVLYWHPV